MELIIHRGTHQIGGTCIEVSSRGNRILLDIGLPLDFDDRIAAIGRGEQTDGQALVKEGILPDIAGIYTWNREKPSIHAILITHSHYDHYGILQYVKPEIPVYMGRDAWSIITKAALFLLQEHPFSGAVEPVSSGTPFSTAGFTVTPYLMDHSAFDAYAYHITDGEKSIIYTGDFRSHGRKTKAFEWFLNHAPKEADALIIEGTMLSRETEHASTEADLENDVAGMAQKTSGMVLAYCSAQNIDRLVTFYRAAKRTGRLFVVDIYTAHILRQAGMHSVIPAPGDVFTDVRVYFPWKLSTQIADAGNVHVLYEFVGRKIDKDTIRENQSRILMTVRPSVKIDLKKIGLNPGSVLIYSLWPGYLEERYVADFVKWLEEQGVETHTIHTSGHATVETLIKTVNRLKPKRVIPVHTTAPDEFGKYFTNVEVLSDNTIYQV